ncbi:breast cancer type 1 susceptibility protein homolog isoform X2 [Scleropages formosus]|uniref:breast cancer type 1 susceptibility protein homolog isoform X2 n=1 Tax=Scleropages formosus TaxID=113540 RepID=UPI0010FA9296|nr:breast cancer type 1 susceptibility protein isoform X2 [Scleropages formosus]
MYGLDEDMKGPKVEDVKWGICVIWENLQCPICLDLMSTPVSTKCDHQFCRFCILKLLDSTKKREANCPICKAKVTKRSLQESPGFQRLVEGLKNMVQAFEQDTCMSYSNEAPHTLELLGVPKAGSETPFCEEASCSDGHRKSSTDNSQSRTPGDAAASASSSVEAKNGFARLMGLEDSSTFISEEGLPSGAHDIPKTSGELDIRSTCDIFVPNTDTLGLKLEKPSIEGKKSCEMGVKIVLPHEESFQHTQGCEDMEICSEENQTDSKRDKILNNSEKKSLEKVSKWLLNISPNDRDKGDPNLDGICHEDSHDCTSRGERSSFTAKGNKDEVQSRNPKQLNHRLPLEEKVFGVTYKRHRKSSGAQISSALPNIRAAVEQPTCGSAEKVQSKTVKKMRIKKLTPTDFIKRPYTGVEGHSPVKDELEGGREVCALKGQSADAGAKTRIDERRETGTDGRILKEKKLLEEEGIVIDGPVGQGTTRNNLQNEFQEFSDGLIPKLTETENGKANKCKQKRNRSNRSAKSCAKKKLFRKPKALDLICGGLSSSDSAPSPSERPSFHEVQIESYPSSNHRGTPDLKGFQQSGRLQPFTKNIQESTRKDHQVDSRNTVLPDSKNGQVQCSAEHEDAERTVMSSSGGKKNVMERPVVQNCCIAFEDMIEIMKDDTSVHTNSEEQCQKQPGTSEHGSHLSFVPNTETLHVSPQHSLIRGVAPVSQIVAEDLPEANFEIPLPAGNVASEPILTETEDCRNDGELDTELLLKTFKSTKRRSFLIGSPSSKRSNRSSFAADKCNLEEEQKNDVCDKKGPEKEPETLYVEDSVELVQQGRETLSFGVVNHLASEETKNKNLHYSPKLSCVGSTNPSVCDVSAQKSCRRQRRKFRNQRRTTSKPLETEELSSFDAGKSHNYPSIRSGSSSETDRIKELARARNGPSSRHSVPSEEVGSELLFPTSTASGEEPQDPANHITENLRLGSSDPNRGLSEASMSANEEHGAYSGQHLGEPPTCRVNDFQESSMTPDGLLPPSVEGTFGKERRRPRRLESSESECSDEEDQLPSFAEMLEPGKSHVAVADKEVLFNSRNLPLLPQGCPGKFLCGEAGRCPNHGVSSVSECIPASQMSVDLFGTPEECDADPCDTGLSGQCSQFSSEIIATQQKLAMQEELHRLEKMMALVTEALHQKGGTPEPPTPHSAEPADLSLFTEDSDVPTPVPCPDQNTERSSRPKRFPAPALVPPPRRGAPGCRNDAISPLPGLVIAEAIQDESPRSSGRRCSTRGRSMKGAKAIEGTKETAAAVTLDRREITLSNPTTEAPLRVMPLAADLELGSSVFPALQNRSPVPTDVPAHPRSGRGKMMIVASGLSTSELSVVKKFAKKTGGSMCTQMTPETTHVIMRTDKELVCERTLKYFLGIAGRKWVVSFHWIAESFRQGKVLDEAPFEVRGDMATGRSHRGPEKARNTNEQKLLMRGFEICFQGSFMDMTTDQLEWMAELCGAKVVKDPLLFTSRRKSSRQLVVVQPSPEDTQTTYRALQKRATVVSRGWLLDSVATYTLLSPDGYKP